ncbi:MAG: hypothetical protein JW881_01025 [Spirochaetales bacterium]|nr:hypothetical protein [Spirochaetales bacterium]
MKSIRNPFFLCFVGSILLNLSGCNRVMRWPDPPVITAPIPQSDYLPPESKKALIDNIAGHYAHYDIVSYEDNSGREPLRSFVITYGFTDFFVENGELYEKDTFLHAKNKLNQSSVSSRLSDKATRAIEARTANVQLSYSGNAWHVYRHATPALLGIEGDSTKSLPEIKDPARFTDPDTDGHPGVTVHITLFGWYKARLYIIRREIFEYNMEILDNNTMFGTVIDNSEQHIIGATMKELTESTKALQHPDKNMSLILLKRIREEIDTWEELQAVRNELFPAEPDFK